MSKRLELGLWVATALALASPAVAATPTPMPAPPPTKYKTWEFRVTPYLWVPTIKGTLDYTVPVLGGTGSLELNAGPSGYLNKLNSALMFTADAHNGYIDSFTDFMTQNFSNSSTTSATVTGPFGRVHLPVTFQANARFVENIWTIAAGAPVYQDPALTANLFIGERFTQPKSSATWYLTTPSPFLGRNGSASFNTTLYDTIGGVKGKLSLPPEKAWFVPYYADVGSGTFGSTSQYVVGIGYGKRASAEIVYRWLSYTNSAGPMPNLKLYGPAFAYTFKF